MPAPRFDSIRGAQVASLQFGACQVGSEICFFDHAAEATFQQIAKLPGIGKLSGFTHPKLTQVRQYPIKGFKNYLIYYQVQGEII